LSILYKDYATKENNMRNYYTGKSYTIIEKQNGYILLGDDNGISKIAISALGALGYYEVSL